MKKSVKYIATVIGNFGGKNYVYGGQTVKTRSIYEQLVKKYGEEKIDYIDTFNWKKNPFKLIMGIKNAVKNSLNILALPSRNGIKVFPKLIHFFNKKYQRKTFYIVIGGWLPELLENVKKLRKIINQFDYIMPETKLISDLIGKYLDNNKCIVLRNSKSLVKAKLNKDIKKSGVINLCTFSRICEEKGILDCFELLEELLKYNKCYLTFYGPIDEKFKKIFFEKLDRYKDFACYGGIVDPLESVKTLSNKDALLFLTKYEGECFPGTIIDAYFAGIPVFAYRWKYVEDIILFDKTGYYCDISNIHELSLRIVRTFDDDEKIRMLKLNCLKEADNYSSDTTFKLLFALMEDE